jgi:uncharacterized membrane protein YbhN (UPF0104 family)
MTKIKLLFRWLIFGLIIFFLFTNFRQHWYEITSVTIQKHGYYVLICAFIFTLFSHILASWVWWLILNIFSIKVSLKNTIEIYLVTNIAKYLPGNIWHFYGRVDALKKKGYSTYMASLTVIFEPILMAFAGLLITLISASLGLINKSQPRFIFLIELLIVSMILLAIHPHVINPVLQKLTKLKISKNKLNQQTSQQRHNILTTYPLLPLLGEFGFLLIRGIGFLLVFTALMPISVNNIPLLLSVFSFAWLLGLIVPGAPGGMGVFEATAIASLDVTQFPPAIVLTGLALFRLISLLAEAIAALIAWLSHQLRAEG